MISRLSAPLSAAGPSIAIAIGICASVFASTAVGQLQEKSDVTRRVSSDSIATPRGELPPNDLCGDATPLTVPATALGTTSGATSDTRPPTCIVNISAAGVWYAVLGTGNRITASTCHAATNYDTRLNVYCGDCSAPICITGNDDTSGAFNPLCDATHGGYNSSSTVTWCSQAGFVYFVLVQGYGGEVGDFGLTLNDNGTACSPPPNCGAAGLGACCLTNECVRTTSYECVIIRRGQYQGDDSDCSECNVAPQATNACADAPIVGEGQFPFSSVGASTDGPNEPVICNLFGDSQVGSDVWTCYAATCSGRAAIDVCQSNYDTKIAAYQGCGCPTTASAIACNDDTCGSQSLLTLDVVAGQHYLVRIGGYDGARGSGTLRIQCQSTCPDLPDGDINVDGKADGSDIRLFSAAVIGASTETDDLCHGDFSQNNVLDVQDMSGFIGELTGG